MIHWSTASPVYNSAGAKWIVNEADHLLVYEDHYDDDATVSQACQQADQAFFIAVSCIWLFSSYYIATWGRCSLPGWSSISDSFFVYLII